MIKRSSSGSTDSFEPTSFSPEECHTIQARLESKIPPDGIAYRSSGGGQVAYLEGWRAFNYANEIFGFNGWSSEILNFTTDFMENDGGKISVGVACTVRIILKDGTFHDVCLARARRRPHLSCRTLATGRRRTSASRGQRWTRRARRR